MTYFDKRYNDELRIREKAFDALAPIAKKELIEQGYKLSNDLILDTQITLALQAGIVPPMWTGFCLCDKCGLSPAEYGIYYKKTSICSFCNAPKFEVLPYSVANYNRLEYWKEVRRTTPAPEIDISDL